MLALSLGLTAALAGGVSVICLAQASRLLGPARAAAWTGLFGIVLGPAAAGLVHGSPWPPSVEWLWAFAAGSASLLGNGLFLFAVNRGKVALVAPIVASAGGLAGVLAVATGAPLTVTLASGGLVLTAGVVLAARSTPPEAEVGRAQDPVRRTVALAALSALALAASYLLIGRSEETVGAIWAYVALMVEVLVVWSLPGLIGGRLVPPSARVLLWVLAAELAGIVVFLSYGRAAESNAAVASLLYGQYALVAAALGFVVFRERLPPVQLVGSGLAIAGTLIIAAGRL